jgi:MOSC domain-containing protein YiiM
MKQGNQAKVVSVNVSDQKGEKKTPVSVIELKMNFGIIDDAHAGNGHRQISLLAEESIDKMRALGLDVASGSFAENVTTQGIDLVSLPIGTHVEIGDALVEVTQIGKECHNRCAIYHQAGDCVMPKEGIFAKVLRGGAVRAGDVVSVL